MTSLFVIIALFFIIYFSKSSKSDKNSSFLGRESNQCFRGLLALLIVFHHVCKYYEFPFSSEGGAYGITVVGLFFFFSGYGLMKQYAIKGNVYCNGFLIKRTKKLLPSFLIISVLSIIAENLTGLKILETGWGGNVGFIIVPNSWYVYVLFFYYIAFVLSCRILNESHKIVYMLLGATIVLIVFTTLIGLGDWWWKSSFAFNVGTSLPLIEKKYENRIDVIKEKKIVFIIFGLLAICAIPNIFELSYQKVRSLLMIMLTTLLPIYLYVIFRKIDFVKNKALHFLGAMSYEIYLVHGIILILVSNLLPEKSPMQCVIIIYLVTFIISWPISRISKLVK